MSDIKTQARAVEQRMRWVHTDIALLKDFKDAADTIAALLAALEAAEVELKMGDDMYNAAVTELEAAEVDAARYRWLTADHDDAEVRDLVEGFAARLRWVGKGSSDAAIDAAIAEQEVKTC